MDWFSGRETELDDLILAQTPETLSELFNGSGVCKSLRLCSNTNIEKLTITLNLKKIDCSYFNLKSLRFVHTFLEDSWKERRRLSKYDYCTEVIDCRGNNLDCLDLRGMDCLKEVHCDSGLEVLLNSDLDRSKIIHEY